MSLLEKDSSEAFFKNPIEQPSDAAILLEGRYRLEIELGRGGFGVVYLARDQKLHDRRVVIKMPMIQSPTDTWPSEKFEQEIKALAQIDHPGVVAPLIGASVQTVVRTLSCNSWMAGRFANRLLPVGCHSGELGKFQRKLAGRSVPPTAVEFGTAISNPRTSCCSRSQMGANRSA